MAKKTSTTSKRTPPELCACPEGSRARVRGSETVCEVPSRRAADKVTPIPARVVPFVCGARRREYRIGAPATNTETAVGKAKNQIIVTGPGLNYNTASKPCTTSRTGCPVQLVFRSGKPHLRFCRKAGSGEPGYMVPVPSASDATRLAREACEQWSRTGRAETVTVKVGGKTREKQIWRGEFDAKNPAVVRSGGTLGGRSRKRRRAA